MSPVIGEYAKICNYVFHIWSPVVCVPSLPCQHSPLHSPSATPPVEWNGDSKLKWNGMKVGKIGIETQIKCCYLSTGISPWQQIGVMFKWTHKHHLQSERKELMEILWVWSQCTGGGCGLSRSPRQWISLWTAPVDPLPTKMTASFSEAFTAFLIISLRRRWWYRGALSNLTSDLASSLKWPVCLEVKEEEE